MILYIGEVLKGMAKRCTVGVCLVECLVCRGGLEG